MTRMTLVACRGVESTLGPYFVRLLEGYSPYHEILVNSPFKGEETHCGVWSGRDGLLWTREHGRPSAIALDDLSIVMSSSALLMVNFFLSCNVFATYVYRLLPPDPIFQAFQDLASKYKFIDSAESAVVPCGRIADLHHLGLTGRWWSGATEIGYDRISDG